MSEFCGEALKDVKHRSVIPVFILSTDNLILTCYSLCLNPQIFYYFNNEYINLFLNVVRVGKSREGGVVGKGF